jgi:hypothetical protein
MMNSEQLATKRRDVVADVLEAALASTTGGAVRLPIDDFARYLDSVYTLGFMAGVDVTMEFTGEAVSAAAGQVLGAVRGFVSIEVAQR